MTNRNNEKGEHKKEFLLSFLFNIHPENDIWEENMKSLKNMKKSLACLLSALILLSTFITGVYTASTESDVLGHLVTEVDFDQDYVGGDKGHSIWNYYNKDNTHWTANLYPEAGQMACFQTGVVAINNNGYFLLNNDYTNNVIEGKTVYKLQLEVSLPTGEALSTRYVTFGYANKGSLKSANGGIYYHDFFADALTDNAVLIRKNVDMQDTYRITLEVTTPDFAAYGWAELNNFAMYISGGTTFVDHVKIYNGLEYSVEDSEGNTLGTLFGYPGKTISSENIAAFQKEGFGVTANHDTFPSSTSEKIIITYYSITEYTVVDEQENVLGKITGETGQPITEETLAAFDKVGHIVTATPAVFPANTNENITITYTQEAGLVEYIDFGDDYAKDARSGANGTNYPNWQYVGNRNYNNASNYKVALLSGGQIGFNRVDANRDIAYRSVALTNDLTKDSVTPGKTYRVVYDFSCTESELNGITFEFGFGWTTWDMVSKKKISANDVECVNTVGGTGTTKKYTLAVELTVPTAGWDSNAAHTKNIYFSLYGNTNEVFLDNVVIYEQVQYAAVDSEGASLGTINGYAGANISAAYLAPYEKDGYVAIATPATFPVMANEKITITYNKATLYTVIDEQGNTIGTLAGEAGQPITEEALAAFDKVGYIITATPAVFPQNKTEKITVISKKEAGFTEYIDFGNSYAASDRSNNYPNWKYVGNSNTNTNAVTYFGDGNVTFKRVTQAKDFYNRSVALANKLGTNTVTPGKTYRVIFSLGCNNYNDLDSITAAFNFLPYRDNGNPERIQTFAAKDLECLETSYGSGTYRRYTLAAELTVPVSANDCNIFFSLYGNTTNVYLDNIYIYEQVQYDVVDSEGASLGTMNGFAGANIPDTALAAFKKDGFDFVASHTIFPLDLDDKITIAYLDTERVAETEEDFEEYPTAWLSGATDTFQDSLFELSTREHKSGSYSLHYQYDVNANGVMTAAKSLVKLSGNSGFSTQGITVKNGATYGLSFYVKAKAVDLQSPVNFSVYAAKGTSGATAKAMTSLNGPARVSSTFTGNGWTQVKYAFTANLTDDSANELFLSVSTEALANAELYIDDITLTEITSDMGVVLFSTYLGKGLYNTSAEFSNYYDFGKVGTKIAFPKGSREGYAIEGWYEHGSKAVCTYVTEFSKTIQAGVNTAYPQWDISGKNRISFENPWKYLPKLMTASSDYHGIDPSFGEISSNGKGALKLSDTNPEWVADSTAFHVIKNNDGSPVTLVNGQTYIISLDIYVERFTSSDTYLYLYTAWHNNPWTYKGTASSLIYITKDVPLGEWITFTYTYTPTFDEGGQTLYLCSVNTDGMEVYVDNMVIEQVDPENPVVIMNKGLVGGSSKRISGKVNQPYKLDTNVEVPGYIFKGWYNNASLNRMMDYEDIFFETQTVYAKLIPKKITQPFENYSGNFERVMGGDFDYEIYDRLAEGNSAQNVHGGRYSLHRKGEDYMFANANVVLDNSQLDIGGTYKLSMWVKMDQYDHTDGAVKIGSTDSYKNAWHLSDRMLAVVAIKDLTDGKWHKINFTFIASGYYLAVQTPGYCSIYMDDIVIDYSEGATVSEEATYTEYTPIKKNEKGEIIAPEVEEITITDASLEKYVGLDEALAALEGEDLSALESADPAAVEGAVPDEANVNVNVDPSETIQRTKKKKVEVNRERIPLTFKDILIGNTYIWYTAVFYGGCALILLGAAFTVWIILRKKRKNKEKEGA